MSIRIESRYGKVKEQNKMESVNRYRYNFNIFAKNYAMLIRYVRMTFREEKVEEFLTIFDESKELIRGTQGCRYLELMKDLNQPNVFMTHSHWLSEEDLNNYRQSELFRSVWARTKVLFSDTPMAFSVESVLVV